MIEAPSGVPLVLEVNSWESHDVTIASADFAIAPTRIPAATNLDSTHPATLADIHRHSFSVGPLQAGTYVLTCQCGDHDAQSVIRVMPSRFGQTGIRSAAALD